MKLNERFLTLIRKNTTDKSVLKQYWEEIETAHSAKKRVYHNLKHLAHLFDELETVSELIDDWETVSWAVFYHDIVYNVRKRDNEEQSAELAVERLTTMGYDAKRVKRCKAQIIATKSYDLIGDNDANLFTDADLSILGKSWEEYEHYFNVIRKEYRIYPALIYNPARKKILEHFLEMPHLFKTSTFQEKYENQARKNMVQELKCLS